VSRPVPVEEKEELDVEVLRALPADVRADVLKTHTVSNAVKNKLGALLPVCCVVYMYLAHSVTIARPPSPSPPPPPSAPIFAPESGPERLCRALRRWMAVLKHPQPVHAELLAQGAVEAVERNTADVAFEMLQTMRRHAEAHQEWQQTYCDVLGVVQEAVRLHHCGGHFPLQPL
jgi:hypothetical protein